VAGSDDLFGEPPNDPIPLRPLKLSTASVTPNLVMVEASGDIDVASAEEFDSCLRAAVGALSSGGRVLVDMTAVSFLGGCGVRSLLQADRLAERRGGKLQLVVTSEPVRHPLRTLGVLEKLHVLTSRDEAV
jgi:anti-anti-sigma factor